MKARLLKSGFCTDEEEILLDRFPITIGRNPDAGIRLTDRWASRRHCELFEQDGHLAVRDLGSTHGTYVNGRRVTAPTELRRGDTIQVGKTVMEVR